MRLKNRKRKNNDTEKRQRDKDNTKMENKEDVIARIHEAANYVPLEQLALSPQCGFASTEEGNLVTDEDQWKKLALVKEIAEEVWN